MKKTMIRALPAFAASCFAASVVAQTTPTGASASARAPDQKRNAPLEEVIVTAQKRAERLIDVPISMSVLDGIDLDASPVQGTAEMLNRVPGVAAMIAVLGTPKLAIRGATASDVFRGGSTPIAYYLDAVPFGFVKSAFIPDSNVYDLDRIEVLRGPQGTLYGANAQNGLVRILTHEPNLDEFEFKARALMSSTDRGGENYRGDAAINVPIVEGRLAARAVVGYQDLSGWIDKPAGKDENDAEISNARLKVKAQLTEKLSLGASAWLSRSDFGGQAIADDNARSRGGSEPVANDYDVFGLELGYEFSGATLSSRTGYIDYASVSFLDLSLLGLTGVTQRSQLNSEVISQELILNSTRDGSWRWTLGGMYRDVEDRRQHNFPVAAPVDMIDTSESYAVFGELTRVFMDGRLELTGGLRYFEDDVALKENLSFTGVPTTPLVETQATFDAVTPRAVLSWHPSKDSTVYASYAEGFRSGFTQDPRIVSILGVQAPTVDSDTLRNYELGAKGRLLGGRLAFDTAVYYMDWEDVQQLLLINVGGIFRSVGANGSSASGVGFEFAVTTMPVEGLELGANLGWNDLTVDGDVISAGVVFLRDGDRLVTSPELTVGASVDYGFSIGTGFEGRMSISGNYISEMSNRSIAGTQSIEWEGDPMLIARASLSLSSRTGWTATLFSENIGNEQGAPLVNPGAFRDWDARIRPRTTGVQFDYRF
jgi:iron complex outermembrane recepter protein